jgi:hypothetical protein
MGLTDAQPLRIKRLVASRKTSDQLEGLAKKVEETGGLEPPTSGLRIRCSILLSYVPDGLGEDRARQRCSSLGLVYFRHHRS